MNLLRYIFFIVMVIIMAACETVIHPALESADPVLVVDAWITNASDTQYVLLSKTQPYFENQLPPPISGATVTVTDNHGNVFDFVEHPSKHGYYIWVPAVDQVIGHPADTFRLNIDTEGETYEASSYMGRVPVIDSVTFKKDKQFGTNKEVYEGQFWAVDPVGKGDAYWIKAYKNGVLLNKPSEINLAYDASFSAGAETDGVTFITPIRLGINPNDTDANDQPLPPYESGDSVNVEIHSISHAAFDYLTEVITQTDRPGGFGELFAVPLANVPTNIANVNSQGMKAVGFFNVSAVSSNGKRFVKP